MEDEKTPLLLDEISKCQAMTFRTGSLPPQPSIELLSCSTFLKENLYIFYVITQTPLLLDDISKCQAMTFRTGSLPLQPTIALLSCSTFLKENLYIFLCCSTVQYVCTYNIMSGWILQYYFDNCSLRSVSQTKKHEQVVIRTKMFCLMKRIFKNNQ